jgi:hypothetical protein
VYGTRDCVWVMWGDDSSDRRGERSILFFAWKEEKKCHNTNNNELTNQIIILSYNLFLVTLAVTYAITFKYDCCW